MKNLKSSAIALAVAIFLALGCNMSTANMSSLKVGKDKAVTTETTSFKPGDTIYAAADISNNPGKVTVKYALHDSKGTVLPGSDVAVDLPTSGVASYTLPLPESFAPGTYQLTADMMNENGEKKDGKSVNITVAE